MQLPNNLKLGLSASLVLLYASSWLVCFILLFIAIYLSTITISFVYTDLFFFFNESSLNPLLANSLVAVHPPLYLIIFFFFTLSFLFIYLFPSLLTFRVLLLYRLFFIYLFICLFLGCWWAFQETYWGGWWFWEVSELLIIFLLILVLLLLHSTNLLHLFLFFYMALLCLAALFIYIKGLDAFFEVTLHSFFSAKGVMCWIYLSFILFLELPLVFFLRSCRAVTFFFFYVVFLVFSAFILADVLCFVLFVFVAFKNLSTLHLLLFYFYFLLLNTSFFFSTFFFNFPLYLLWFL